MLPPPPPSFLFSTHGQIYYRRRQEHFCFSVKFRMLAEPWRSSWQKLQGWQTISSQLQRHKGTKEQVLQRLYEEISSLRYLLEVVSSCLLSLNPDLQVALTYTGCVNSKVKASTDFTRREFFFATSLKVKSMLFIKYWVNDFYSSWSVTVSEILSQCQLCVGRLQSPWLQWGDHICSMYLWADLDWHAILSHTDT